LDTNRGENRLKNAILLAAALTAACASTPVARDFAYSDTTPLGQSAIVVRIQPGHAVIAAGDLDLAGTTMDQRMAYVMSKLGDAQAYARTHQLVVAAPPLLVNRMISPDRWQFDFMLPIAAGSGTPAPSQAASVGELPSGAALALDHHGPQTDLFAAYARLEAETPSSVRLADLTWEQYLTVPGATAPEDQRIRVFRAVASRE
jgi:hypothetical protein